MIYNDFKGLKLSALGMGNMRLPTLDGDDSRIDEAATEQILDYCMAHALIITIPPGATTAAIQSWWWASCWSSIRATASTWPPSFLATV